MVSRCTAFVVLLLLLALSTSAYCDERIKERRAWALRSIDVGEVWRGAQYRSQLGPGVRIRLTNGNQAEYAAYYYKESDITLIKNTQVNRLARWRLGKSGCLTNCKDKPMVPKP